MGDSSGGGGLPPEVPGLRASDYDCTEAGGEKHQGASDAGAGYFGAPYPLRTSALADGPHGQESGILKHKNTFKQTDFVSLRVFFVLAQKL